MREAVLGVTPEGEAPVSVPRKLGWAEFTPSEGTDLAVPSTGERCQGAVWTEYAEIFRGSLGLDGGGQRPLLDGG